MRTNHEKKAFNTVRFTHCFSLSQGLSYFKVCIPHAIKRTARAVANGYFIKIFVLIVLN